MPATSIDEQSSTTAPPREQAGDGPRPKSAWRQWLGTSGIVSGTGGTVRRIFRYSIAAAAVIVVVVNTTNVVSWMHDRPASPLFVPVVAEGTSGLTFLLFFWIPWLAWLWAPPLVRPRWKLLIHIPGVLLFALGHIGGFMLLRRLIAWMAGVPYFSDPIIPQFSYELRKDVLSYLVFAAGFALVDHLVRQRIVAPAPACEREPGPRDTFDIRDGAKLTRVPVAEILAVSAAGNYVEFVLEDGRRLLMRSSLSALEGELAPLGFLRTHRSWLVNRQRVTALKPAGSGDYEVDVATLTVPLSRRFSNALAKLREAGA